MTSLLDLLQTGGTTLGNPDLQDPIEQLKALLARQQEAGSGALETAAANPSSFGSLSPMPTTEVAPRAAPGIPYAQMPAPQTGYDPMARIDETAPKASQSPSLPTVGGLPMGEKIMSFLSGLSGDGGLKTMRGEDKTRETENLTVKTLLDRGIASSPDEARAIARNPAAMQTALVSIFAPKGFNLKSDEKRFMPGATSGSPAVEIASGEPGEKTLAPGAALTKGGRILVQNAPKVEPGYEADPNNPGATRPIPGGSKDEKFQTTMRADKTAMESSIANISRSQQIAKDLLAHKGIGGNFGISGAFPNLYGGDAAGAKTILDQFKAVAGFQALQDMRDASKTGGALGNVSNAEGQRLENSKVALGQAQNVDDAKRNLSNYIREAEESKNRVIAAFHRAYGSADTRVAPPGRGAPAGALPDPLGLR